MAAFGKQPSSRTQRKQSGVFDDSLSEISSTSRTTEALRREKSHRQEADQLYQRLQSDYDNLLTKYAQAENTIDQLRIGAKLNLYSDLPPPQQSVAVSVSKEKQPRIFSFPRANQAVLSRPGSSLDTHGGARNTASLGITTQTQPDGNNSDLLTPSPEVRAEGLRTSLLFQVESLQENVEDLQEQVTVGEWGEPELKELHEICTHLRQQHGQMKRELKEVKNLEGRARGSISGNESVNGDYLPEDSLEGQLYRLGLRLDEVNEQIEGNLRRHASPSPPGGLAHRNSNQQALPAGTEVQQPDTTLQGLVERLKNVKDASKQDDNLSRSANSLADVEDLDSNDEYENADDSHSTRNFSLDPLPHDFDDDNRDRRKDEHGLDLQESGYFASEAMSVSLGDQASEPLSTAYLSNSAGAGQLNFPRDDTSLFDQQSMTSSPETNRRLSHGSVGVSPNSPKPRATSHHSRTNSMDTNHTTPQEQSPPSPPTIRRAGYPDPTSSESPQPQASSSMLPEQPRPRSLSHSSRRSRAGSTEFRNPRDRVGSDSRQGSGHADILRTNHDEHEPVLRDRIASTQSSPRNSHDALQESPQSRPRRDSKRPVHRQAGRQRSLSSADSRVSTPLFLPHHGARPKDANIRDKRRPATADTERGFDSGFFGSEGSRISRSVYSPELGPSHLADKIHHPLLREPSITESDEERIHVPATHTPQRTVLRPRDQRRRRSRLQSLSGTDEDRGLDTSSKTPIRSSPGQRERRGHRHTPTFPATRSDTERSRRFDDSLPRHSSSPNLFDASSDRLNVRSGLGRSSATPSRLDSSRRSTADAEGTPRAGPRSDHDGRPIDKQSMRSYPGMDRESVRSGRRSRRDGDSSSAYSDGARKYKRDAVDKLRQELQRLGAQLQDEASARTMQAHMYDELRRKHDDLEREIARKNAEQQMSSMYDGLRNKYDDLAKRIVEPSATPRQGNEDEVKKRLEELSKEVNNLKNKGSEGSGTVRFLCPFCGGFGGHHHGDYYYPGFAGPVPSTPVPDRPGTPRGLYETGTQTPYGGQAPQHVRHQTTPVATSTPFFQGVGVSPGGHYHTNTYPGVVAGSHGILAGSPIHHIHHLPAGRSPSRILKEDDDDYSSDEDDRYRSKRRSSSARNRRSSRRTMGTFYEDEQLDSRRLHMSLDEANKAARHMQRVSKRMLSSIASDLIRSGQR